MRCWFPSYSSEIFTVCSPTERSSWVLRAEPWKWKYANIYSSLNNRSEKWYDLDFLTRSSGTSSWTVGSSSMISSMLSLFPPSWLTMYFWYIYFFHFCSTVLCSEVFRRFQTLFLLLHYCSLSSQQKHSITFGVWTTHLKRSVSIDMTWILKSLYEYLFFSYCIDLKTSF